MTDENSKVVPFTGFEPADVFLMELVKFGRRAADLLMFVDLTHGVPGRHPARRVEEMQTRLPRSLVENCFGHLFSVRMATKLSVAGTANVERWHEFKVNVNRSNTEIDQAATHDSEHTFRARSAHVLAMQVLYSDRGIGRQMVLSAISGSPNVADRDEVLMVEEDLWERFPDGVGLFDYCQRVLSERMDCLRSAAERFQWDELESQRLLELLHGEYWLIETFLQCQSHDALDRMFRHLRSVFDSNPTVEPDPRTLNEPESADHEFERVKLRDSDIPTAIEIELGRQVYLSMWSKRPSKAEFANACRHSKKLRGSNAKLNAILDELLSDDLTGG